MLRELQRRGVLRPVDRHLAEALARRSPGLAPEVALAAALASRARAVGTRLDLSRCVGLPLEDAAGEPVDVPLPPLSAWLDALRASPLVSDGSSTTPLVLRGHHLWLQRAWRLEARLGEGLGRLAAAPPRLALDPARSPPELVDAPGSLLVLADHDGTAARALVGWLAALLPPGGGAALAPLLLAPTEAAAARHTAGLRASRAGADLPEVRAVEVALEPADDGALRLRRGRARPWPTDVVVLLDAHRLDPELLARAVEAVPPGGRLALVGAPRAHLGPGGAVLAVLVDALAPPAVVCWRGRSDPLGQLAAAIERGGPLSPQGERVSRIPSTGPLPASAAFLDAAVEGWLPILRAPTVEARLAALTNFRVLTAADGGAHGAIALQRAIEATLARRRLADLRHPFHEGRPVRVTRADPHLGLDAGDVGVVARDGSGEARVFFPRPEGVRAVLPGRLPPHAPAWAVPVAEAREPVAQVLFALPHRPTQALCRDVLAGAVLLAQDRLVVAGDPALVEHALATPHPASTGLAGALARGG